MRRGPNRDRARARARARLGLDNGGKQEGRPCGRPFMTSDTLCSELDTLTYWQASQVPPLRMASMEHAFFSSAVYSFFGSDFGAFSTVAFSMLEAPRVRR